MMRTNAIFWILDLDGSLSAYVLRQKIRTCNRARASGFVALHVVAQNIHDDHGPHHHDGGAMLC